MNGNYVALLNNSCAFIPCYTEEGRGTQVYCKDGKVEYTDITIKRLINDYCAINMRNFESIKGVCQNITGRKAVIPLYIKKDAMLIPIKAIKPRVKGDMCFAYVNVDYIKDINFQESRLEFINGYELDIIESEDTLKKRIAECTLLKKKMLLSI